MRVALKIITLPHLNFNKMILHIFLILSGLILSVELMRQIPIIGDELEGAIKFLSKYSRLIGGVTLILGLLKIFGNPFTSLVAITVGLVLLVDHLDEIPAAGGPLKTLAQTVEPFDEWIGLGGVIIGIIWLLF